MSRQFFAFPRKKKNKWDTHGRMNVSQTDRMMYFVFVDLDLFLSNGKGKGSCSTVPSFESFVILFPLVLVRSLRATRAYSAPYDIVIWRRLHYSAFVSRLRSDPPRRDTRWCCAVQLRHAQKKKTVRPPRTCKSASRESVVVTYPDVEIWHPSAQPQHAISWASRILGARFLYSTGF